MRPPISYGKVFLAAVHIVLLEQATGAGLTNVKPEVTGVAFGQLNPGADPSVAAGGYIFGETKPMSGWTETTAPAFEPVEDACDGDCVKLRLTDIPGFEATIKTKLVVAGINVAFIDNIDGMEYTEPFNQASHNDVKLHEEGHVDIATCANAKASTIWKNEVTGYVTSCQSTEAACEAEWGTYEAHARTGSYMTNDIYPSEQQHQQTHSHIKGSVQAGRWIDPNPGWAQAAYTAFSAESFQYDSTQTKNYPPADGDNCVDDDGGDDGCEY